jgi:protein-disulfide isomerase
VLGQLMAEYRGKLRLVYKDFPLPSHPGARPAAMAARCAGDQGQYWAYHDLLFLSQPDFSRADLLGYAARLKLDGPRFATCLDRAQFREQVEADFREGEAADVTGTPTFFVNGLKIGGLLTLEDFRSVIEDALRQAGGKRP